MEFEEFATARLPALSRYAVLLCGDREQARDMVQEVLARAFLKWRRIATADDPYAYVRRMLTNEYLSWLRRRRLPTVPVDHDTLPAPQRSDNGDELWKLLGALPRQQRAVIVLRYYEGLTDLEIADVLGCRPGTVRGYASRALTALRIELTEVGVLS
ncbi:SigE family RNA polymerase sigma factor [Actinoplanes sp. CA-015351]|uniref:SigE family RNA polymerase sigma factor n=1 Tax=Actinoplanes sp. CA-015351 TaxID=3239897 RepID=UPI003D9651B9